MKINPIYVEKNLRPRGGGSPVVAWYVSLLVFGLLLISGTGFAQKKEAQKDPGQRKVNTAKPKSEDKLKSFEDYEEFVIADFRAGTVEDIVQDEESGSLQTNLQSQLPVNRVFKSTASKVCIIGVEGTANAKMVLALVNNKTAKVIKKADLEKALSKINVKIITKE
jgi:hypothetical protein